MKRSMILIISLFFLIGVESQAQQSNDPILTITLDTSDLKGSKEQLMHILSDNGLVFYPGLETDLGRFVDEAVGFRRTCPGFQDCPADPEPNLAGFPCPQCFILELKGLIESSPYDSIQAGYLQLELETNPMSLQYHNGVMAVNSSTFNFTHDLISNTLLLFSLVGPQGRSNIQAIIIADKHILRQTD